MIRNRLHDIWQAGRPVLNGWLSIGNAFTAEIMAAQGYDSLTIDLQHGALDYSAALPMLQALRASGVVPMARVPWLEPGIIMKALDAGALGIICPMVSTAADAARFAACMRYPPRGMRSYGPTRAAIAHGGYGVEANDAVLAFAMIETAEGLANLDEIAATPGLDGIYVGPADLTLDTQGGRFAPGFDREEPEMIALLRRIATACRANGIHAGLHCGTPDYALRAISWGYDLTTVSGDSRLLAGAASASVAAFRRLTEGAGDAAARAEGY
ncbi:MAG: aldolase/citrate lyase family protein [Rhodobacteraceae bacterium]|nr:aldolase/citrate lyase family protein [Paracoccaceae bacterium]